MVLLLGLLTLASVEAQTSFRVEFTRAGFADRLVWPSLLTNAEAHVLAPEFRLERSRDLLRWEPLTGPLKGLPGRTAPAFTVDVNTSSGPAFYRVRADFERSTSALGENGGEVLGFAGSLRDELAALGPIALETFTHLHPPPAWHEGLSFDPTQARYWSRFDTSPADWNAGLPPDSPERRIYDFRLNAPEKEVFLQHGFVVSERLGAPSFGDLYYRLWTDDMPVFITTDSILQAWHRSFENMLVEIEQLECATTLQGILQIMRSRLPAAWTEVSGGPLWESVLDADYFLTVAASLLDGVQRAPAVPGVDPAPVTQTLADIRAYATRTVPIFGGHRTIDFSQFTPRGHYTLTPELERYFQAMMWCGQVDLRLATYPPNEEDDLRQLGAALVLFHLSHEWLEESPSPLDQTKWTKLDQVLGGLFGPVDSMTFAQLRRLVLTTGRRTLSDFNDLAVLETLQAQLESGLLGTQLILGYPQDSPLHAAQLRLPRSFTLLGQRFSLDSWALANVVFDRIAWPVDEPGEVLFGKVLRRKPSCLDVAFSVLGNDTVVPELADRIAADPGVPFRDGLPYQHNLLALRRVIESQAPSAWTRTVYERWLRALRTLSPPLTESPLAVPQAMRTRAWALKDLNSQLAGWTQLRHDTLLYAKQSYTAPFLCDYPDGFVEPRPEFFARMRELAAGMREQASHPLAIGWATLPNPDWSLGMGWEGRWITVDISAARSARTSFLDTFMRCMSTLEGMALKELNQQPFSPSEVAFIKTLADSTNNYVGERQYSGWYPRLFYRNVFAGYDFHKNAGCDYPDALIVDVHTDRPDPTVGDPGGILHQAVGNVNLLLIAVDNGPDRAVYAGPVLSHYEMELPIDTRWTDQQWKARVYGTATPPPPPAWTRSYLVPK